MKHSGGCHCGKVRFEVETNSPMICQDCNCSICSKSGFIHLIVPRSKFSLVEGEASLSTYTFGTKVAQHYFCKHCGIKPFYVPRSNPDGVDVNFNCLDSRPGDVTIEDFDGTNWEQNTDRLSHLSKD